MKKEALKNDIIVIGGGPRSGFGKEADDFLTIIFRERGVRVKAGPPIEHIERSNNAIKET